MCASKPSVRDVFQNRLTANVVSTKDLQELYRADMVHALSKETQQLIAKKVDPLL